MPIEKYLLNKALHGRVMHLYYQSSASNNAGALIERIEIMSKPIATAVISKLQVVELQALFSSYGEIFYIKDASEQSAFVRVYLYGVNSFSWGKRVFTGWDLSLSDSSFQFDSFYKKTEELLKTL